MRNCITNIANVAELVRLRADARDHAQRALLDGEITRLHELGYEAWELSREMGSANRN